MIYYFSATGNSQYVAQLLAEALQETSCPMTAGFKPLAEDKRLLLVFPVHSWGPAISALRFLQTYAEEIKAAYSGKEVWCVCTCGDDCGQTDEIIRRKLQEHSQLDLQACYSVQMPNNYILLPGFDLDSQSVENEKIASAPEQVKEIVRRILAKEKSNEGLYLRGRFPSLKSHYIYPFFVRFMSHYAIFQATDACVGCGLCQRVCPSEAIQLNEQDVPEWNNDLCTQCLACLHRCPQRAIEYGKMTQKKGRYVFKLKKK